MSALSFHKTAFEALYDVDGLVILGRGLGAFTLLRKLIALHCEPGPLAYVLNLDTEDQTQVIAELAAEGTRFLPRAIATEEAMTAAQREKIYAQGGVVLLSSRSLVTDLLQGRVPHAALQAVIVWRAHTVKLESLESLALRLIRAQNPRVAVSAISESAETVSQMRAERVLKALTVRDVFLYPRYHESVKAALETHRPDMVELAVQLAPFAQRLHERLFDTVRALLAELRLACPTAEPALFAPADEGALYSIDSTLRASFDGMKLTGKARLILDELAVLRRLLLFLPRYDAVAFLRFFDVVRKEALETHAAHWPYYITGQEAWKLAQRRVQKGKRGDNGEEGGEMEADIEANPKWVFVRKALEEIAESNAENAPVLILARDGAAVHQLMDVLRLGIDAYLKIIYEEWSTAQKSAPVAEYVASPRGGRRGRGRGRGGRGRGGGGGKATKGVIAENIAPAVPAKSRLTPGKRGPPPPAHAKGTLPAVLSNKRPDIAVEVIEVHSESDPPVGRSDQGESGSRIDSDLGFIEIPSEHSEAPEIEHGSSSLLTSNVYVRTHTQGRSAMWSIEPRYVILYDMDLASVRQCECFRATRPGSPLRLYALIFENCAEERAYADSVLKENDAFEALIEEKARLVLPPSVTPLAEPAPELPASMRNASVPAPARTQLHVIVDTRELRAGIALPSLLQLRGARLHAVALDAGDYVLTPELCVERKALPDLVGSFADGRLYAQTERLSRLYRRPILLIEGNADTPFSLQSAEEVTDEVSHAAISSKLALLCLHFPQLRVLWSRDAYQTAELFMSLKAGAAEPDVKAVKSTEEEHESRGNEVPQDILRRLPGVNRANMRALQDQVSSLRALSGMSFEALEGIMHSRPDALRLHSFLNRDLRHTAVATTPKQG